MVLSDKDIRKALEDKELEITGVEELHIGSSSVDLHMADDIKVLYQERFSLDCREDNSEYFEDKVVLDRLVIEPGRFYLIATKEKIRLGKKTVGFLQGRSSLARLGLNIHCAGFFDSGFEGTATLEVTNMTENPIVLYRNMRICQIVFAEMKTESEIDYSMKHSKYQGQEAPGTSKIFKELQ